jgi:hypothetical protein
VTVVTTIDEAKRPFGTATAFLRVTGAIGLVCLDKKAESYPHFEPAGFRGQLPLRAAGHSAFREAWGRQARAEAAPRSARLLDGTIGTSSAASSVV